MMTVAEDNYVIIINKNTSNSNIISVKKKKIELGIKYATFTYIFNDLKTGQYKYYKLPFFIYFFCVFKFYFSQNYTVKMLKTNSSGFLINLGIPSHLSFLALVLHLSIVYYSHYTFKSTDQSS